MIESRFAETASFSVGVEEELMVLDAESLALAPRAADLIAASQEADLPGTLKSELFASALELNTGVCESAADAAIALAELRRGAARLAEERGLKLAAAGSHPFSPPLEQEIADEPRYLEFVEYAGVSARRQGVSGLHVHIGMPSAEACFHALEGVLPWLPVVLAWSANSPYLAAEETGLVSNRAEALSQLPRNGAPPAFRSYSEWEEYAERFIRLGVADDYTILVGHPAASALRHPGGPDARPADRARAHRRLRRLAQGPVRRGPRAPAESDDPAGRGMYQQNRWAASRFGLAAELVHPNGQETAQASDLVVELAAMAGEDGLDPARMEADRQLEVGRAQGLEAVCADLVERTVT